LKIKTKDFRVREGEKVNLKKWPTLVTPVYKSKEQYQELFEAQVGELSALQELHYASNCICGVADRPDRFRKSPRPVLSALLSRRRHCAVKG